jgi:hypothetical protein
MSFATRLGFLPLAAMTNPSHPSKTESINQASPAGPETLIMLNETARLPLEAELTTHDMMHLRKSVPKTGTGATKYEEMSSKYLSSLVESQWKNVSDVHLLNRLDSDANFATTAPAASGSSRKAVSTLSTTAPVQGQEKSEVDRGREKIDIEQQRAVSTERKSEK